MKTMIGRASAFLVLLGAVTATGAATAAERQGVYLRGDLGASLSRKAGGSVVDGSGFQGDLGNSVLVEAGVGYQLPSNFRVDLTAGYRPGLKVSSRETFGGFEVTADADVRTWAVMANAYYDIDTGTAFTPYVGAGLGVAFNRIGDITYRFGVGEIRENGHSKTSLAWSLQTGVAYAVMENVKLDAGYRYIDLGKFETGGDSTVGAVTRTKGDVRAHELKLAVRYQF